MNTHAQEATVQNDKQNENGTGETEDGKEPEQKLEQKTDLEDAGDQGDQDSKDGKGEEELPEWARKQITDANTEAANYRVRMREAQDKLENAKTLEEVDTIINEMKAEREEAERSLLLENAALKHKLPEGLQKRLKGKTREEIEADAKELAELFATQAGEQFDPDLEGGLNPRSRDDADPSDPRGLAKKYGRKRGF